MKLSICIPTYNRSSYLAENLNLLLPQVEDRADVNVLIFDNNSTDKTEHIVKSLISKFKNVEYIKNENNIGYVGNQIKCIEFPKSDYIAILCDDDVYLHNAIDTIVRILSLNDELSFIALNYYSFKKSYNLPIKTNFAPTIDKIFERAYDILNYPSVGHFSGFIFNRALVQAELSNLKKKYKDDIGFYFEKHRGIITHLANTMLSISKIPAYFIGQHVVGARVPDEVDYDLLNHMNLDYLNYYHELYKDGVILSNDYEYRKKLVLSSLPKAIWIESCRKSKNDFLKLRVNFDELLFSNTRYRILIRPMFKIAQISYLNYLFNLFYILYKRRKV